MAKSLLFGSMVALVIASVAPRAQAQPADVRYAEEPTIGLNIPTAPMAGEFDAFAVVRNPAGLHFLRGGHFGLAFDFANDDDAITPGAGGGVYLSSAVGGGVLPRVGYGIGLEFLRPPRVKLDPDPGTPARLTIGTSVGLGDNAAFGFSWHRFFDEDGRPLDGEHTFDLGITARAGAYWAAGVVVRDLLQPEIAGVPVQRRYEAELASRPFATDRLELALGGRIGEIRGDIDGWFRFNLRVIDGLYWRGELLAQTLHEREATATALDTETRHDYRVTTGIELSLGSIGAVGYVATAFDDDKDARFRGTNVTLRLSTEEIPSVLPDSDHIERLDLKGAISDEGMVGVIAYLRRLERDDHVIALFLNIDGFAAGWATTNELRAALERVKKSGKKIFAFMVAAESRQYYLASVADKVWVDPAGGIRLQGFAGTSVYYKGLFDKLGIQAQFEKIEEYKSAPEAFTRTGPTEPAFRMRNELYDSIYDEITKNIASSRHITQDRVKKLIDKGPYTSGDLENLTELVDGVTTSDDLPKMFAAELGATYPFGTRPNNRPERWSFPKIAIINITGDIVSGKSSKIPLIGRELVGGDTIAQTIAAARADSSVVAIILRVNSPGGSALASEIMAREVFKTRGVKPIICSMADLAASGGYFVSAGCDKILADPMTITGSIGIFNGKFDASGFFSRIGLSWTTFKRGERSDMDSIYRPYTDEERSVMKEKLHYYYGRFTKAVSDGRGMTQDEVDEIGRGHVWTGVQAKQNGLIDQYGGLSDAITMAKVAAGMEEDELASLEILPKEPKSLLAQLFGDIPGLTEKTDDSALLRVLLPGASDRELLELFPGSLFMEPDAPQARLPFGISWK